MTGTRTSDIPRPSRLGSLWRPPSRPGPSPSCQEGIRSTPSRSVNGRSNSWTASNRLFRDGRRRDHDESQAIQAELYEQIGRLKMEVEWLKKKAARFG